MIERESKNTHQMGLEGEILTSSIFFFCRIIKVYYFSLKGLTKCIKKRRHKIIVSRLIGLLSTCQTS